MTRRRLYQLVAERAGEARSAPAFLRDCTAAMRTLRDMPAMPTRSARELLNDSEMVQILRTDDALGQIYQALNAPRLEAAYRRTARLRGSKFEDHEIPAVTQLFTPRWVIEFLLRRTLGSTTKRARDIRILDPACGTMNFGIVAIEMLTAMYRDELDRSAEPSIRSVEKIPDAILEHNLVGMDIDSIALELAAETIEMKLGRPMNRNRLRLYRADALFDSVVPEGSFDVVVANPPYLSARNLPRERVLKLKRRYPRAWRDEYACFIQRCLELVAPGGRVGMLTMQSFMFTGAFEKLRRWILDQAAVETIAHYGPGLFDIGNPGTLQTVATVMRREPDASRRNEQEVVALRLVDEPDKQCERPPTFKIRQLQLQEFPRAAWTYWLIAQHRNIFTNLPRILDVAPPRQGLATTDNARFVRYWWEVEPTTPDAPCRATEGMWRPYVKSGRFRRWYEAPRHRVNWLDDGREIKQAIVDRYAYLNGHWKWVAKNSSYYGRAGLTYSYLTSGRFSARQLPEGTIFDVAGSALFPDDPLMLLAVLNSSLARELLAGINPTVNFQVGDLAQLPVPRGGSDALEAGVMRVIQLQKQLDAFDETSPDFVAPMEWRGAAALSASIQQELAILERKIDQEVHRLYGLEDSAEGDGRAAEPLDPRDLARRWVSFGLRRVLARGGWIGRHEAAELVYQELCSLAGHSSARHIVSAVDGIGRFLEADFFDWHTKLYHGRPTLWLLGDGDHASFILHDHATADCIERAIGGDCHGWDRFVDDGVQVNLAPLWKHVPHRGMQKRLKSVMVDMESGRMQWSGMWQVTSESTAGLRHRQRLPRRSAPGRPTHAPVEASE